MRRKKKEKRWSVWLPVSSFGMFGFRFIRNIMHPMLTPLDWD